MGSNLATVQFIEHFVPPSFVKIVGDIADSCATIAAHEDPKALQLLAHGIFAAGKEIHWQTRPYFGRRIRVGQPCRSGQKRFRRFGLKSWETKGVVHELHYSARRAPALRAGACDL